MTAAALANRIDAIAYSASNYKGGFIETIARLQDQKIPDEQIIALLRSNHARWAADMSGKAYGEVTAADFMAYMERYKPRSGWSAELKAMVAQTLDSSLPRNTPAERIENLLTDN